MEDSGWAWQSGSERTEETPVLLSTVFILNMWYRMQRLLALQDSLLYPGHHSRYQEGSSYESPKLTLISCLSCVRHWTEHIANRILLRSQNSGEGTEQLPSSLNRWRKLSLVTITYLRAHYKWQIWDLIQKPIPLINTQFWSLMTEPNNLIVPLFFSSREIKTHKNWTYEAKWSKCCTKGMRESALRRMQSRQDLSPRGYNISTYWVFTLSQPLSLHLFTHS